MSQLKTKQAKASLARQPSPLSSSPITTKPSPANLTPTSPPTTSRKRKHHPADLEAPVKTKKAKKNIEKNFEEIDAQEPSAYKQEYLLRVMLDLPDYNPHEDDENSVAWGEYCVLVKDYQDTDLKNVDEATKVQMDFAMKVEHERWCALGPENAEWWCRRWIFASGGGECLALGRECGG